MAGELRSEVRNGGDARGSDDNDPDIGAVHEHDVHAEEPDLHCSDDGDLLHQLALHERGGHVLPDHRRHKRDSHERAELHC